MLFEITYIAIIQNNRCACASVHALPLGPAEMPSVKIRDRERIKGVRISQTSSPRRECESSIERMSVLGNGRQSLEKDGPVQRTPAHQRGSPCPRIGYECARN